MRRLTGRFLSGDVYRQSMEERSIHKVAGFTVRIQGLGLRVEGLGFGSIEERSIHEVAGFAVRV